MKFALLCRMVFKRIRLRAGIVRVQQWLSSALKCVIEIIKKDPSKMLDRVSCDCATRQGCKKLSGDA